MSIAQTAPAVDRSALVLRVLVSAALGISAYLHVDLASGPLVSDGKLTLAGLFVGQAVAATLVAIWVLVRGDRLALTAAALLGFASLAALILTVYVNVPSIGPLPAVYEPIWYVEKVLAAVVAAAATLVALLALARLRRR